VALGGGGLVAQQHELQTNTAGAAIGQANTAARTAARRSSTTVLPQRRACARAVNCVPYMVSVMYVAVLTSVHGSLLQCRRISHGFLILVDGVRRTVLAFVAASGYDLRMCVCVGGAVLKQCWCLALCASSPAATDAAGVAGCGVLCIRRGPFTAGAVVLG
jgi:hypothetical protein